MPRIRKQKVCYRSIDDSRKPKCRRIATVQCNLCQLANDRYNVKRQDILHLRKFKNKQAAMKSRDNKALKWDDLLAENFALQNQKEEVTKTLAAIERDKQQLIRAIHDKSLEKAHRINQRLSNVSKFIVQHPEDTIAHLQETFGDPGTHEPHLLDTIHQSPDTPIPSTSSSGNSYLNQDPLESLYMKNAIYVNNLPPGLQWSDLSRFCIKYGSIKKIMKKSSESTSAVVIFHTTNEAKLALEALNGQTIKSYYIEGHQQITNESCWKVQFAPLAVCKGYKFLDI